MKRWIIFISVFILSLSLVISLFVIWKAGQPFSDERDKAELLVLKEEKLKEVSVSEVYNGSNTYVTVSGNDVDGKGKVVFVPITGKDLAIEEVMLKDGISKKQAIDAVQTEFKVKEVLHTKLGWEQDNAVWEITFLNENDKLNYVYLLFEDGKWWKRILNL
ncbi:DUF5590 domain-containing protein [Paenisporosarcina macmurdoensis]|uniref:DUF5590 domain-containing protein n=1 Tax=Paenisporosarcina macmurdoensis TaxID=212659 RepID=A0ABW1L6L8_9BACL